MIRRCGAPERDLHTAAFEQVERQDVDPTVDIIVFHEAIVL